MTSLQGIPAQGKAQFDVICELCQRRKIKCDRQYPCSNCIKANTICTPKPLPPPRKKRGPNPGLLAKLVHCEKLLEECANRRVATSRTDTGAQPSTPTDIAPGYSNTEPTGKLIFEDGVVNFTQSPQWTALRQELQAMRRIVELDSPFLNLFSNVPDMMEAGPCMSNSHDWQPSGTQGLHLWQIFLSRVHPVTKIIHAPSIQPHAAQAAYGFSGITPSMRALLFSIYNAAVFTLSNQECIEIMGSPKKDAASFCAQALRKHLRLTSFLTYSDLTTLQALVFYLLSLQSHPHTHSTWIFSGICVRVAQKMGLHRDGEDFGLSPFETEIRRRLWWQIYMLDARSVVHSGLGPSLMSSAGDCKKPTNLNDADYHPEADQYYVDRDGPTEMIICMLIYKMSDFLREQQDLESRVIENEKEAAGYRNRESPIQIDKLKGLAQDVEESLESIIDRFGDPSVAPVYKLATQIKAHLVSRIRAMSSLSAERSIREPQSLDPAAKLFTLAVNAVKRSVEGYRSLADTGFLWFMQMHFQFDLFAFMVAQISHQHHKDIVDEAWVQISEIYYYHEDLFDESERSNTELAVTIVAAWETRRQDLFIRLGYFPDIPDYIQKLGTMVTNATMASLESMDLYDIDPEGQDSLAFTWNDLPGYPLGNAS